MPRVIALYLLAACGRIEAPGPDGNTSIPPRPTIMSISPADGATGVRADTPIVVTFDTPMDAASVAAAWSSDDLPAVAFAWNDAGDAVTITAPLEYAEGIGLDPSTVVARTYTFRIAATASDVAGHTLDVGTAVTFATRRRLAVTLDQIDTLTRTMQSNGVLLAIGGLNMPVGDSAYDLQYKIFTAFSLPVLPAAAELDTATLNVAEVASKGNPLALGAVEVHHLNTATIDIAAFTAAPLDSPGVLPAEATPGPRMLDVTTAVGGDLVNHVARGERTMYRFELDTPTNSDGIADTMSFGHTTWRLDLSYLVD